MTLNTVIFVWWTCLYIGNHLHFCTSQWKYIFPWHDKEPGHNPSNYWGSSFHFCHLGSKEGDSGWAALNIHLCCYCKERWAFELSVTYYNIYKAYKPYTHIFFSSFDFLNMRSGIVKLKIFSKLVNLKKNAATASICERRSFQIRSERTAYIRNEEIWSTILLRWAKMLQNITE